MGVDVDVDADADVDVDTDVDVDMNTDASADVDADMDAETDAETDADTDAGTDPGLYFGLKTMFPLPPTKSLSVLVLCLILNKKLFSKCMKTLVFLLIFTFVVFHFSDSKQLGSFYFIHGH